MIDRIAVPLVLSACLALPALAQSQQVGQRSPMLIHGNYCGMGNNAPEPPIDALDAACARHDACTPANGLPARACNIRLGREAELISRDPRQPDDLRALAGFISAGAVVLPYDPIVHAPASVRAIGYRTGPYYPVYDPD
ncbi:hypothetical protein ACLBWX_21645 [Methylobacterium sp. M6A4_1b]